MVASGNYQDKTTRVPKYILFRLTNLLQMLENNKSADIIDDFMRLNKIEAFALSKGRDGYETDILNSNTLKTTVW